MADEQRGARRPKTVIEWATWWQRPFAPLPKQINWSGPNCWIAAILLLAALSTNIPLKAKYFGLLDRTQLFCGLSYLAALLTRRVAASFASAVEGFEPATSVEAKRANEQIKLTATLINGAAGAAVSIFALAELIQPHPSYLQIIAAVGAAVWVHSGARSLIGLLKDEVITLSKPNLAS